MPTVLRQNGFDVMIFAQDHEPAHVHVYRAEGKVKIALEDVSVIKRSKMSERLMRQALDLVAENQAFLLSEWDRING